MRTPIIFNRELNPNPENKFIKRNIISPIREKNKKMPNLYPKFTPPINKPMAVTNIAPNTESAFSIAMRICFSSRFFFMPDNNKPEMYEKALNNKNAITGCKR